MCSGGGGSYTAPKVDPAPTAVQSSDVDTSSASESQKRKRGRRSTMLSDDRTLISSASTGDNTTRNTLG